MANVIFNSSTTGNPDSLSWDFGDGQKSTAMAPLHSYAFNGVYVVRLTAVKNGVQAVVSKVVPITSGASISFNLLANNAGAILADNSSNELAVVN